ncbi:MAG: hypothetical protein QGG71_24225, partial [Pirellulaceae bacterium]|nr:hypothetical protein [Pirellulaceae bacterium]
RRKSRGTAWYWRQTDSWYYTPPGTKRRVRLLDEDGRPIRGTQNRPTAELALARVKATGNWRPQPEEVSEGLWLVGRVCSEFIEHCKQRAASGSTETKLLATLMTFAVTAVRCRSRSFVKGTFNTGSNAIRHGGLQLRNVTRSRQCLVRSITLKRCTTFPAH